MRSEIARAMQGIPPKRAQDQQIQGAGQQIDLPSRRRLFH
jgi:hypothetical protein